MQRSLLVVMALEIEAQGRFEGEGVDVLYTGIGKVNAAYRLTRRLLELKKEGYTPFVVNFGTAGSPRFPTGTLVACRRFVQRDMDVTGLGFAEHQTPFEDVPRELEFEPCFPNLPQGVCASGDSFEASGATPRWDVVDMEAYALAKVCLLEQAPFGCVKYVTDGADGNAAADWKANLPRAADSFVALLGELRAHAFQLR